jgi:hypothetical protein
MAAEVESNIGNCVVEHCTAADLIRVGASSSITEATIVLMSGIAILRQLLLLFWMKVLVDG